jgi:hypothetical protein
MSFYENEAFENDEAFMGYGNGNGNGDYAEERSKLEQQESYYKEQEESQQFVHGYKDLPLGGAAETEEQAIERTYMKKINELLENKQLGEYKNYLGRFKNPPIVTLNPYALVDALEIYDKEKKLKKNKEWKDSVNYRAVDLVRYYRLVKRVFV